MNPPEGYERALVKLSGEAFKSEDGGCLDDEALCYAAGELAEAARTGRQLAVVVGAGNIVRGAQFRPSGRARLRADYAGILGTVINGLFLQDFLERNGVETALYSGLSCPAAARDFDADGARRDLGHERVVILAGGTGNPLFTTDTAAALRAVQLGAQVLLKATRVRGVFSADPERDEGAEFFEQLSYGQVLERRLGVMDLCAVSLCMEHALPVRVFNYGLEGNLRRVLAGEPIGTLIGQSPHGH